MRTPTDVPARVASGVAVIAALIALAFATSGRLPGGASKPTALTMARVSSAGTIRVAVVPAPPITGVSPNTNQPSGYAIDVIEAVARNSGLKVSYHISDWATFAAELASNQADLAVGPIFMTEGRARDFAFSDPLFAYAIVAVGKKDSILRKPSDLARPGIRIAVGRGGFDADFVKTRLPEAVVNAFPPGDVNLPLLEIIAGRSDFAIADAAAAQAFCREHPELEILFGGEPLSLQYAAFMVRNDDWAWREFLNVGLRNLDLSGDLNTIDTKYADRRSWYARVSAGGQLRR